MSSYIDHREVTRAVGRHYMSVVTHSWEEHTRLNLAWHYGPARAAKILTGYDTKTQADVLAWNALGRRAAA